MTSTHVLIYSRRFILPENCVIALQFVVLVYIMHLHELLKWNSQTGVGLARAKLYADPTSKNFRPGYELLYQLIGSMSLFLNGLLQEVVEYNVTNKRPAYPSQYPVHTLNHMLIRTFTEISCDAHFADIMLQLFHCNLFQHLMRTTIANIPIGSYNWIQFWKALRNNVFDLMRAYQGHMPSESNLFLSAAERDVTESIFSLRPFIKATWSDRKKNEIRN